MKKIYFLLTLVTTTFALQSQQNLALSMIHLQRQLQALERALKESRQKSSGLQIFSTLEIFSKLLDDFFKLPSVATLDKIVEKVLHEITFEGIEQLDVSHLKTLRETLNAIDEKMLNINQSLIQRGVALYIQEEFFETVVDTFKREKTVINGYIAQKIIEFQQTLFDQSIKKCSQSACKISKRPDSDNFRKSCSLAQI